MKTFLFAGKRNVADFVSAARYRPHIRPPLAERLEERRVLSATPSDFDQFMLALINRARANPSATAAMLGIDLNQGLAPGTIPTTPVQPLAFNTSLIQSAQDYTQALLGAYAYFGYGLNGTTTQSRMTAAGYIFSGNYSSNENIYAFTHPSNHPFALSVATVTQQFDGLFVDSGVSNAGNRTAMLDPSWKEAGVGVMAGKNYQGTDTSPDHSPNNAIITTQDFAHSDSDPNPFLTGAAFVDNLHTSFYAPGEGLGGLTITATRASDSMTFTTTTFASGGYSLAVPAGTYTVVASGTGLSSPIAQSNVVVADQNVEEDFIEVSKGVLTPSFAAPVSVGTAVVGQKANITAKLSLTNTGNAVLSDKVTVAYYLSASGMVDANAVALRGTAHSALKLVVGKQSTLIFRLTSIPANAAAGNNYLVAQITDASGVVTDVATAATLAIQPAQIDLTGTFVKATPSVKNGKPEAITISVSNNGNVAAIGSLPIQLALSTLGQGDPSPIELPLLAHQLHVLPGKSFTIVLHATIAGVPDNTYFVLVSLDPADTFHDVNTANNVFASGSAVITVTS